MSFHSSKPHPLQSIQLPHFLMGLVSRHLAEQGFQSSTCFFSKLAHMKYDDINVEVANFCAAMDTLVDQDGITRVNIELTCKLDLLRLFLQSFFFHFFFFFSISPLTCCMHIKPFFYHTSIIPIIIDNPSLKKNPS